MTKFELRRLNALARRFILRGHKDVKKSRRLFKKAGCSAIEGGTGDEGWRECIELGASGYELIAAGQELRELLFKLKGSRDDA